MLGRFVVVLPLLIAGAAVAQAPSPVATVQYSCAQGKSLIAEYFDGPTRTAPDGRPIPGGRVVLTLADGKKLTLPQTLSGSGIRYANESVRVLEQGRHGLRRGRRQPDGDLRELRRQEIARALRPERAGTRRTPAPSERHRDT